MYIRGNIICIYVLRIAIQRYDCSDARSKNYYEQLLYLLYRSYVEKNTNSDHKTSLTTGCP